MSGATEAAEYLRAAATAHHGGVKAAADGYGRAYGKLAQVQDVVDVAKAAASLALAAEQLATDASAVRDACRAALAKVMDETGMPNLEIAGHRIVLTRPAPAINVTDRDAIPRQFFVHPPIPKPFPDMTAIRKALKDGPVAGVQLSNGGPPTVAFRVRKDAA